MKTKILKGSWEEHKRMLIKKFVSLTDNELFFAEGKKNEMFGRLQIKLGITKEELNKIISGL